MKDHVIKNNKIKLDPYEYTRAELEALQVNNRVLHSRCRNLAVPYLECLRKVGIVRQQLDPL